MYCLRNDIAPTAALLTPQSAVRANRLSFLLEKSTVYAKIIGDRMERQQIEKRQAEARAATRKANKESRGEMTSTREGTRGKGKEVKDEKDEVGSKRKRETRGARGEKRAKVDVEEVSGVSAV
jgi:ATP-dependent DNA helicase